MGNKGFSLGIILIAVLVIGVIAFIAYPLFSPSRDKIVAEINPLDALVAQRESTYDALRDLDFDFQMGKLSESDYTALREKYKARAAQILQQIDALAGSGASADADAQIEARVAQLRRAKSDSVEAEIARLRRTKTESVEAEIAQVRAARKSAGRFCAKCGTPHQTDDQFCAKCGNKL